jgi:tryptophan synthase alpha subunit
MDPADLYEHRWRSVGFGVRDRATAARALGTGADGVIVGTALEEFLADEPRAFAITLWIRSIAAASPR